MEVLQSWRYCNAGGIVMPSNSAKRRNQGGICFPRINCSFMSCLLLRESGQTTLSETKTAKYHVYESIPNYQTTSNIMPEIGETDADLQVGPCRINAIIQAWNVYNTKHHMRSVVVVTMDRSWPSVPPQWFRACKAALAGLGRHTQTRSAAKLGDGHAHWRR